MIAMLVLAAIGFVLVAFVIARIGSTIREEAGPQACLGALTAQNWMINQLGEASASARPWPRSCRTKDKTLEGETAPEVSQKLIRLLSDCWYQMGSGRFSPFEADWTGMGNEKCFICNTFRAPNLQEPISDVRFNAYLKEISHPNSDMSLYDTFNQDISELYTITNEEDIPLLRDEIVGNEYYALIFFDVAADAAARVLDNPELGAVTSNRPDGGGSKLYIATLNRARECHISGVEMETGD